MFTIGTTAALSLFIVIIIFKMSNALIKLKISLFRLNYVSVNYALIFFK